MKNWQKSALAVSASVLAALAGTAFVNAADEKQAPGSTKPALTVTTVKPQRASIATTFSASGNIAAWQDAIIGAEVNGLRLNDVRVNIGDVVKRGQVLATFAPETLEAELAQSRASVAEAEAALAEAQSNADRAKTLEASGALSTQQINQYTTAAKTAEARLAAARAVARASSVRVANTRVVAPDSGTISARAATVGAVVMGGQELFRMVRQNRLEWRAEVTSSELAKIRVGQKVSVMTPAGASVAGKVRVIAPTVDPQTRNVQVYVDLAAGSSARAGMFARGEFELDATSALTLPQQAVVVRDGFSYVFVVKADNRVTQQKIVAGRRLAERIEVREGLSENTSVAAQGAGFLNDGDLVKVTAAPVAAATRSAADRPPQPSAVPAVPASK